MILKDLIAHVDFDKILEVVEEYADSSVKESFKKNVAGYSSLFDRLKKTDVKDSGYIVCLENHSCKGEENYDASHVYLKSEMKNPNKISYCFCLADKEDWVSFEVLPGQERLYYLKLLVACLYDMTFYGFTEEQVEESRRMLNASKPFDPNNAEEVVHHLNEKLFDLDIENNTDCFCYTNYTTDESISFNNQVLWSLNEDSSDCVFDVVKKKFQEITDRMVTYTRFF